MWYKVYESLVLNAAFIDLFFHLKRFYEHLVYVLIYWVLINIVYSFLLSVSWIDFKSKMVFFPLFLLKLLLI